MYLIGCVFVFPLLPGRREHICILKAAREEGLNEGIRAMFSAGLGGALMKVGFLPFLIS